MSSQSNCQIFREFRQFSSLSRQRQFWVFSPELSISYVHVYEEKKIVFFLSFLLSIQNAFDEIFCAIFSPLDWSNFFRLVQCIHCVHTGVRVGFDIYFTNCRIDVHILYKNCARSLLWRRSLQKKKKKLFFPFRSSFLSLSCSRICVFITLGCMCLHTCESICVCVRSLLVEESTPLELHPFQKKKTSHIFAALRFCGASPPLFSPLRVVSTYRMLRNNCKYRLTHESKRTTDNRLRSDPHPIRRSVSQRGHGKTK